MDKILITGANGGLGAVLRLALTGRFEVVATDSSNMDVTDWDVVNHVIGKVRPKMVIHCAAIVNADQAQRDKARSYAVNVRGTENIVQACNLYGAALIFFSSDYVFNGLLDRPYCENDLIDPINYYGVTKIIGEQIVRDLVLRHYIVRVSWLFGPAGNTFFQKICSKASEPTLHVVSDQIGSPTYTPHLTKALIELIQTELWGTYHITSEGFCSWADYAKEILHLIGSSAQVIPVSSDDYVTLAKRPLNSRLSKEKAYSVGICPLPHWKEALCEFITGKDNGFVI